MINKRTPLIAGNWKMNLDHLQAIANVQKLSWSLSDANHDFVKHEVAVFPPFTDLRSMQTLMGADKIEIALGAQDLSPHQSGAFTGDISGAFLSKLDVKYVLTGHSERREGHGETDEIVTQKTLAAIANGLVPVVCVGETEEDLANHGPAATAVKQLEAVLSALNEKQDFVVAYEPVWAIGTGKSATPAEASSVCSELRRQIEKQLGADVASRVRILYGGSVTSENVAAIMREPNIDGVLVGGASLKPEEFSKIAQFSKHVIA